MSAIPSNLARVPNLLAAQIVLGSLNRTNLGLLQTQVQLATGKLVNRPSDDAVAASTISVLDDIIERRNQRVRNLTHGESVLGNIDAALDEATAIAQEARGIGLSQIGVGSDSDTRQNEAKVIDLMLNEMVIIANRQYQDIFLFGGDVTARTPIVEHLTGLLYQGGGDGMSTDLGLSRSIPITMSGADAFGSLSARVKGDRDLDPGMVTNTRLVDLNGARGLGVSLGSINVDVGGTDVTVDLSEAHTVADVISAIQTGIQTVDPAATVGISASGDAFAITLSAGFPVTISDLSADATAADLGIAQLFADGVTTDGSDVDPKLTELTPVASLTGVTVPLGTLRLINGGQTRDLDLSGATNVQDIINAVEGLKIGIRVEIAATGDRLDFLNELSGGQMSIAEVAGGTMATELGVRSFTGSTLLADFNGGLGVQIRSGSVDPVSGLPDPVADLDFRVTIKDGRFFDVDLAGTKTVQDVLDAINAAAVPIIPADFTARLAADGNGIEFVDNTGPGTTSVTALNTSFAAEDLGILGSTTSAIFSGEDRATVAVDSVFTHLMDLRDALMADDERGISLAVERLEPDITQLTKARAEAGVRSRRITDSISREEDLRIQDMSLRSQVQDLDFTEAAIRFATLQTQLEAGLRTAAQLQQLSLIDFLR